MKRALLWLALLGPTLAACTDGGWRAQWRQLSAGDDLAAQERSQRAERGRALIAQVGCGSCHTVPGVRAANGRVAPPLDFFSRRSFIAGQLPNTSANLVRWLKDPPAVEPGTAMPNLGLDDAQARDVAAYLETLE